MRRLQGVIEEERLVSVPVHEVRNPIGVFHGKIADNIRAIWTNFIKIILGDVIVGKRCRVLVCIAQVAPAQPTMIWPDTSVVFIETLVVGMVFVFSKVPLPNACRGISLLLEYIRYGSFTFVPFTAVAHGAVTNGVSSREQRSAGRQARCNRRVKIIEFRSLSCHCIDMGACNILRSKTAEVAVA